MRDIPISVIASWPIANHTNPVTRGPAVTIVSAVGIGIVAAIVFLRLYVRIFMLRWFGADDAFIIIALISAVGMSACSIVAYEHFGYDHHIWDMPLMQFREALILAYVTKIVYSIAACFTRLSLLLYYYRLTKGSSFEWFRICIHATVGISVLTGLTLVVLDIFQCSPINAYWTFPVMPNQQCLNEGYLTLGCGIANTLADFLVVVLPIPLIARLELPRRRRIGAIALVSLGFIVCIAGIVRAYYTWVSLIATYDETWNAYGVYLSATIEIHLGVICACLPAMRVLLVKVVRPRIQNFRPISVSSSFGGKGIDCKKSLADLESITQAGTSGGHLSKSTRDFNLSQQSTQYRLSTVEDKLHSHLPFNKDAVIFKEMEVDIKSEHLWEEPWTGTNRPGRDATNQRHVSLIATNEKPSSDAWFTLPRPEIALQTSLMQRTEQVHQHRHSRVSNDVELLGHEKIGVLPDSTTTESSGSIRSQPQVSPTTSTSPRQPSSTMRDQDGDESDGDDVNLPIQGNSKSSQGRKEKRKHGPQMPKTALKTSRPPQLDFDFDFENEKRSASNMRLSIPGPSLFRSSTSPSTSGDVSFSSTAVRAARGQNTSTENTNGDRDDHQAKCRSFVNNASQESLSMTPVKRYVRQQHSLLWDLIQEERLMQLRSSQQTDELRYILQGVRPSSSNV